MVQKLKLKSSLSPERAEAVTHILKAVVQFLGESSGNIVTAKELSRIATVLGVDLSDFVDDLV